MSAKKEKITFLIEVKIKDSDGQIKTLSKIEDFEIEWRWGRGGIAIEVGTERNYVEANKAWTTFHKGKIVEFTKNDKVYKLLIKINKLTKKFFKDKVSDIEIEEIPGSEFEVYMEASLLANKILFHVVKKLTK